MKIAIDFDVNDPNASAFLRAILAGIEGGVAAPAKAKKEAAAAPLAPAPAAAPVLAPAPVAPAPIQPTAPMAPAASPSELGGIDITACKTAFTAFVQKHGPAVGKNLLMEFQVPKVADLNPAHFATFIQRASA